MSARKPAGPLRESSRRTGQARTIGRPPTPRCKALHAPPCITIQRSTGTAQLRMSLPRARRHGGVLGAAASTRPSPVWESASGVPSTGSTPTCTGRSAHARLPSATRKCVCAGCCTASRPSHPARANGSAVAGCYRPRRERRLTFARTQPLRDDPRIRTQSVVDPRCSFRRGCATATARAGSYSETAPTEQRQARHAAAVAALLSRQSGFLDGGGGHVPWFALKPGPSAFLSANPGESPGGITPPGARRTGYVEFHVTGCMSRERLC